MFWILLDFSNLCFKQNMTGADVHPGKSHRDTASCPCDNSMVSIRGACEAEWMAIFVHGNIHYGFLYLLSPKCSSWDPLLDSGIPTQLQTSSVFFFKEICVHALVLGHCYLKVCTLHIHDSQWFILCYFSYYILAVLFFILTSLGLVYFLIRFLYLIIQYTGI